MGILTVSLYYSLASKLKFYYTDIKNNFTNDNKYLAVVNDSGLWLKDETFIKMKPTIIQVIFGLILLGGLYTKHLFLEKLLGTSIKMEREGWERFTRRFSFFFFSMALLNEFVWRTQSTDFWVNFKVFGILILTIIFLVSQLKLLQRFIKEE